MRLLKSDVSRDKNVPCLPLAIAAQFFRASQKSDMLASEVGGRSSLDYFHILHGKRHVEDGG